MKKIMMILTLAVMALTGCGGHEELVFDIQDSVGKGQAFVIEPFRASDDFRSLYGTKTINSVTVSGDIDKCIASAIKAQQPDGNIIIGQEHISSAVQIINIRDFTAHNGMATNHIVEFTADVIDQHGNKHTIKADGGSGFLPFTGSNQEAAEKACKNFIDQAKDWF